MPIKQDTLEKLLKDAFPLATLLEVKDLVGDENHYQVKIVTPDFIGKSKVRQHQMVYQSLGTRVGNEIHALSLDTSGE